MSNTPTRRGTSRSFKSKYESASVLASQTKSILNDSSIAQSSLIGDIAVVKPALISGLLSALIASSTVMNDPWVPDSFKQDIRGAHIRPNKEIDFRALALASASALEGLSKITSHLVEENRLLASSLDNILQAGESSVATLNSINATVKFPYYESAAYVDSHLEEEPMPANHGDNDEQSEQAVSVIGSTASTATALSQFEAHYA